MSEFGSWSSGLAKVRSIVQDSLSEEKYTRKVWPVLAWTIRWVRKLRGEREDAISAAY